MDDGALVTANSGMSALTAAILATADVASRERPLAVVPNHTFTATALAARLCGYEIVIADTSIEHWNLRAADVVNLPSDLLKRVGLVLPVAAYGRPVSQTEWQDFVRRTGIPVAIDAASCFELLARGQPDMTGSIPVALSFHATKTFSTGEGGAVVCNDASVVSRALERLNFGFRTERNTESASINGKMNEYCAAVGLAELDGWNEKLANHKNVAEMYGALARRYALPRAIWTAPQISSCYVLVECRTGTDATRLAQALKQRGIDTRQWYGDGLAAQRAFKCAYRVRLPRTVAMAPSRLLGLPIAPDLAGADIDYVCSALSGVLGGSASQERRKSPKTNSSIS